jgi:hypothetical protein
VYRGWHMAVTSPWTVTVDTAPGAAVGEEAIERVQDALNSHPLARGAHVSLDVLSPNLTATFRVEAGSMDEAMDVALSVFAMALEAAGIATRCGVSEVIPSYAR